MASTARAGAVVVLVVGAIVVAAAALWQLRLLILLLLVSLTLAAGMRPGVEALARRRVPIAAGILLHYAVLLGLVALILVLVVPRALTQTREALGGLPPSPGSVHHAAGHATGLKRRFLLSLEHALRRSPTRQELLHPAVAATRELFAVAGGISLVLAVAAYWIRARGPTLEFVCSLLSRAKRQRVRDTWARVELRLGSYLRGVVTMVLLVSTVLSAGYWALGVPYWLLLGPFSGVVEILPIIGPLLAGGAAIAVALTVSWQLAAEAAAFFVGFRLLQDYVINPRVIGGAVGLPALVVLVAASTAGLLLGPAAVALATPLTVIVATVVDVAIRGRNPRSGDDLDSSRA